MKIKGKTEVRSPKSEVEDPPKGGDEIPPCGNRSQKIKGTGRAECGMGRAVSQLKTED